MPAMPEESFEPIIDRDFAEKFMTAVDDPYRYHVYFLFHDFWSGAPQSAIDGYMQVLMDMPGAKEFIGHRHIANPLTLDELADCADGTLGHAYRSWIVDNNLEPDLARNYHEFNTGLTEDGTLDRMPEELSYMAVRGFQIHDFCHVMTGFSSTPAGELAQGAFHFAQMQFPYNAFRTAATLAHVAFVRPELSVPAMDALVSGWQLGRSCENLHFTKWESELDTPLADLRERVGIKTGTYELV